MNWWLARAGLSHPQLCAVAAWALGEDGIVDGTVLSRARTGKLPYGLSLRALMALAAANEVIHLWQVEGPEAAIKKYGPFQAWGVREATLTGATWLPDPEDAREPLRFADLCEIQVGLLALPYLPEHLLSPGQAAATSDRLADLLNDAIAAAGLSPRAGLAALLQAYPVDDARRRKRLQDLILGADRLTADELPAELLAIAEAIRHLRGLPQGSYGPAELQAELKRR